MRAPSVEALLEARPLALAQNLAAWSRVYDRAAEIPMPPVSVDVTRARTAWRCRSCRVAGCYAGRPRDALLPLAAFLLRHRACAPTALRSGPYPTHPFDVPAGNL